MPGFVISRKDNSTRIGRYLIERSAELFPAGLGRFGKVWAAHRKLIRTNRAYESAVAAAGAHVFTRTSWERLLAALITGPLDLYAVLRRAGSWSSSDDEAVDATSEDGWMTA